MIYTKDLLLILQTAYVERKKIITFYLFANDFRMQNTSFTELFQIDDLSVIDSHIYYEVITSIAKPILVLEFSLLCGNSNFADLHK